MSNSNKSQVYHIKAKVITGQLYNGVKRLKNIDLPLTNAVEYMRN